MTNEKRTALTMGIMGLLLIMCAAILHIDDRCDALQVIATILGTPALLGSIKELLIDG